MAGNIIFKPEWLEDLKQDLSPQDIFEICGRVIYYSAHPEEEYISCENISLNALVRNYLRQIDNMTSSYINAVEQGKKGGVKMKASPEEVYMLASTGMTAKAIGEQLGGISGNTIQKNAGWIKYRDELKGKYEKNVKNYETECEKYEF